MDIFKRIEKKAEIAAQAINFDLRYIPGVDEDLDIYCAYHELMNIYCYGATKEEAVNSARQEAAARLMENSELTNSLLKSKVKN
jgi:hypothetical protein